jgi:hypothetical protein
MALEPLVAITISVAASIYLYLIVLLLVESPNGVEYCQFELPSVSSSDTVLSPLYIENAYSKFSVLPNTSPQCPQLVVPSVYFIQTAALEKVRGLNLNKCYPVQEPAEL